MESKLVEIEAKLRTNPRDAELWLQKGLQLVDQGMHYEAVEAYSVGLSYAPDYPELRLARGRRYISLKRFPEALADTATAAKLQPENFDNWYYQGVAAVLYGDLERGVSALEECLEVVMRGPDESLRAPVVHWLWVLYMRLGRKEDAKAVLENVSENTAVLGMAPSYHKNVLLYKGILSAESFLDEGQLVSSNEREILYFITECYALSNYYYMMGNRERSNGLLLKLKTIEKDRYAFAYMLAEQDMEKRGL